MIVNVGGGGTVAIANGAGVEVTGGEVGTCVGDIPGVVVWNIAGVGSAVFCTVTTIGTSKRTPTLSTHEREKVASEASAPVHPFHKGIVTFCPEP